MGGYILLVMLYYHFMLHPYYTFEGNLLIATYLLHYVAPIIYLAWWLLFDRIQDEDTGVARLPGLGDRQETIERWCEGTGRDAVGLGWYEVLALFQLSITRGKTFADRRRLGLPVPDDNDTRSVLRLMRRIDALLGC